MSEESIESVDIIVVGGGTAGVFAGATAARAGLDVRLLERKSAENAGDIACGDAIKGASTFPDVIDRAYLREASFSNESIGRAIFRNPTQNHELTVDFGDQRGVIVDRKRYGEVLLEEAERAGVTIEYNTFVTELVQEDGAIVGVDAVTNGTRRTLRAPITIDATGALSLLQETVDFSDSSFDTNVDIRQFCSAYREIIEVDEPVDWADAIVFKPTEELGYLWYFPRTPTEINVGLGFQMTESPMALVDVLKRDIEANPEFVNPRVTSKLGAALPTRRPYDSAVAPGYMAVGDAAAHVNPATGGGIPGAAKAGYYAANQAVEAIGEGAVSESALWPYNHAVMTDFGKRFAAIDLYNIWATAYDVDTLAELVASLPGKQLADAIGGSGTPSVSLWLKLKTIFASVGHWGRLRELARVRSFAEEITEHYERYPAEHGDFANWKRQRDAIMERFHHVVAASPKY